MNVRMIILIFVLFGLNGCPNFDIGGGAGDAGIIYMPSNVAENAVGQKYVVIDEVSASNAVPPPKSLYAWDAGTQLWVKKTTFASETWRNEIYVDAVGNVWLNDFSYLSVAPRPVIRIDTQTFQTSTYSLGSNRFMVGGDQAVEYQGSLVNSYQPTTGTSTYLYNLPSSSVAAQAMGITLNNQAYKMLCMPVLKYAKWGGQMHYCMLANQVAYIMDASPIPTGGNNDVIEFMVTIANTGNTYQLINHFQTPMIAIVQSPPVQGDFAADYPIFSPLVKSGCVGSVDKQGNYHQFCNDTGDSTKFTYRFYDKATPTTPLYTQVLP